MQVYPENIWILYLIIAGFGFLGVIFLCIGIGLHIGYKKKQNSCTQKIIATVIDIRQEEMLDTSFNYMEPRIKSWFPIYEYFLNGIKFREKAFVGTPKAEVKIGGKVPIWVDPNNPKQFFCPSEKRLLLQKIFTGIGIVLLSTAVLTSLFFWKCLSFLL